MDARTAPYVRPEVVDFGGIGSSTFINPGGSNKGQPGHDPFSEISVKDDGGGGGS